MKTTLRRVTGFGMAVSLALIGIRTAMAAEGIDPALLEEARALASAVREQHEAYGILRSLTAEVGPRLAGSAGDRAAVAWAEARLAEQGFQHVRAEPVTVARWEPGETEVRITTPFSHSLVAVALGGSVGSPERGIEAPVIAAQDIETLSEMPESVVRGKIVYLGERIQRTRDASGYHHTVRNRVRGPSLAAARGAVALVVRSVGTSDSRVAHTGALSYETGVPRIPAMALSNPDADLLESQLATGRPVTLHVRQTSRVLPAATSANVIGEIPGSDLADEIVLLAAHLDSWHVGTGAADDGAGVAIVMEAARRVAAFRQPRRTLRVVLYANEESDLDGALNYAERHADELGNHVAAVEADRGAGPVWRLGARVPDASWALVADMVPALSSLGVVLGANGQAGGADIEPLAGKGVPLIGMWHDATDYFDVHHSDNDTLALIDRDALSQTVSSYAAVVHLLANMESNLGHLDTEVRH